MSHLHRGPSIDAFYYVLGSLGQAVSEEKIFISGFSQRPFIYDKLIFTSSESLLNNGLVSLCCCSSTKVDIGLTFEPIGLSKDFGEAAEG